MYYRQNPNLSWWIFRGTVIGAALSRTWSLDDEEEDGVDNKRDLDFALICWFLITLTEGSFNNLLCSMPTTSNVQSVFSITLTSFSRIPPFVPRSVTKNWRVCL